jgi:hypothetical protein
MSSQDDEKAAKNRARRKSIDGNFIHEDLHEVMPSQNLLSEAFSMKPKVKKEKKRKTLSEMHAIRDRSDRTVRRASVAPNFNFGKKFLLRTRVGKILKVMGESRLGSLSQ